MTEARLDVELLRSAPTFWNDFIESDGAASFCHLAEWGEILASSFRIEPLYLIAKSGAGVEGVLPLVRMPRLPWGTSLVSMPFLNYGGPIGTSDARARLLDFAVREADRSGDRRLELRMRSKAGGSGPSTPPGDLSPGREKITVVLDLPDDPDVLFKDRFGSKLRAQIRRPMKEGMEVEFGPDRIDHFYEVFAPTMRDLGTPVLPASFFRAVVAGLGEQAVCGVVYHEGRPVAGGLGFVWKGEFEMTWAASLWEFKRQAPNMLLYWSFMERSIEQGLDAFNFGRCTPGSGTHRFKSQWGSRDEPLPWLQWPHTAEAQTGDSGGFALATSVWRKLPLPIANALGPMLARRLPTF